MFSRREPTQPQKVIMNMRTPIIISIMAGSTDRHARAVSESETEKKKETLHLKTNPRKTKSFLFAFEKVYLPACFAMRAYTPITTINREIILGVGKKRDLFINVRRISHDNWISAFLSCFNL